MSKTAVRKGLEERKPLSFKKALATLKEEHKSDMKPEAEEARVKDSERADAKEAEVADEEPAMRFGLPGSVTAISRKISHLEAENCNLRKKLDRVTSECDTLRNEISALRDRISVSEAYIARIEGKTE